MGVQLKSMNANAAELPYLLTKRGTHYSTVVITHIWLTTKDLVSLQCKQQLYPPASSLKAVSIHLLYFVIIHFHMNV
jgi:hypothetical protein